jgi:hypothetical protein
MAGTEAAGDEPVPPFVPEPALVEPARPERLT